ncbi:MAG: ATP-binding protein [Desulfobacteraceae bacterium]|nr:ATP-binding protein [Desulfobacteraceae bacterium]
MKRKHLMDLMALGEGFTTEFKRASTSNLRREICAFANATGGVILIGVTDKGKIVGVADHNRLKSEVQAIARSAEPRIEVSEHWFTVSFPRPIVQDESLASVETGGLGTVSVQSLSQVCPKSVPTDLAEMIMQASTSPVDMLTLMALAGHTNRTRFRKTILQPLIDADLMELTIPDKPRSSKQRYRLTELGQELLKRQGKEQS